MHPKKGFFKCLTESVNVGWAEIQRRVNEYKVNDQGYNTYASDSDESIDVGGGAPMFHNPIKLSKKEYYYIVHHFAVFSMFDGGFQNKT